MSGILLSSNGKITRAELALIAAPEATLTHQPLAHYRIVEALLETLGFRRIQVMREEYAVYLVRSGRMCVAGLNTKNVEATAVAMAAVLA